MALFVWDEKYSVNIRAIDQQHKRLISIINELNNAMKQGKSRDVMNKIISELVNYTNTHFKFEEDYFAKYGYPHAALHKKQHAEFVAKISDFKEKFLNNNMGLSIEVMNFLKHWLVDHIMGTDKKYVRFFNDKGVK